MALIGQSVMRPFCVEHLKQAVYVVLPVVRPFFPFLGQKPDSAKQRPPIFRCHALRFVRSQQASNFIQQAFHKYPKLSVCSSPIASDMCVESLIQMAARRCEAILLR